VAAAEGEGFMSPGALVLGVVVNGEPRAYPHNLLWWHEIINDVLGGRPILVTYCPLTGSGLAYDPVIAEQHLNFGTSGLLFHNNLVMFDRATQSLRSQMRVEAICGSFSGTVPGLLPVVQSTWSAWKALHPDTTIVSFRAGFNATTTDTPTAPTTRMATISSSFRIASSTRGGLSRSWYWVSGKERWLESISTPGSASERR
jgi:hypothetical protein